MGERLNWQEVRRVRWSEARPPAPNGSCPGGTDYYERTWERVTWPDDGSTYAGRTYEQQWTRIGPEEGRYHVITEHSTYPATEEYGSRLPVTTTGLAAWLTEQPRFRDRALFDLLAGIYGRDFTGTAYVQACLKVAEEAEAPKPPARQEPERCGTCGRSAHWKGSGWQGHAWTPPRQREEAR